MPPPDSSNIDSAIISVLVNDPPLLGMMPDGVYFDEANPGATRYVIVSLVQEFDTPSFTKRTIEEGIYLVKAVALSTTGGDVRGAAARIDALLEDTKKLNAPGFVILGSHRIERVRATEVDEVNPDLRWQHRGGRYRVQAALLT
jgi:hypothetical protein